MKKTELIVNILIIFISFTLTGCSIHKSGIKEPLVDIPSSYSTAEANTAAPVGRWWEHFGDERLDQIIEEAFRHNLDIAQAYERLRQVPTRSQLPRVMKLTCGISWMPAQRLRDLMPSHHNRR
jgi:hypothetical protein